MTRLTLPLCSLLLGCLDAGLRDAHPDGLNSRGEESDPAAEELQPILSVYCEDDDTTWCTSFTYDGSEFTVPNAEVVQWYWELDGASYEGAVFSHTFTLSGETQEEFTGKVEVTDSSGGTHTAELRVQASMLYDGSSPDPYLFWFNGIQKADDVGYGCYQGIVAIGGCVQSDFTMGWRDRATGSDTPLYEQIAGNYTVLDTQNLTQILIGPSEMRFRLFLPTPTGTIVVDKLNGQIIEHDSSCQSNGSGQ